MCLHIMGLYSLDRMQFRSRKISSLPPVKFSTWQMRYAARQTRYSLSKNRPPLTEHYNEIVFRQTAISSR